MSREMTHEEKKDLVVRIMADLAEMEMEAFLDKVIAAHGSGECRQ